MTGAGVSFLGLGILRKERWGGQWAGWGSHPDGDDVAGAGDDRKAPVH